MKTKATVVYTMVKGRLRSTESDSEWLPEDESSEDESSEDEPDIPDLVVPSTNPIHEDVKISSPPLQQRHHHHKGLDISNPNETTICDTYTQGGAFVFCFAPDGTIIVMKPRQRFKCSPHGSPLFIKSSCIRSLPRDCQGSVIFYKKKRTKTWHFAIISAMRHLQALPCVTNYVHVHKWISSVSNSKDGVPNILRAPNWDVMKPLVEDVCLELDNIVMYFVNQVSSHLFYFRFDILVYPFNC